MNQTNIRNFCVIAHIDHGKSTLADRFLEITETVDPRQFRDQILDSMDLEREKGITIKLKAVRMRYDLDGQEYQLNLIDTPGHVDFSYEVSRSLAACEGAILVVDASQGIQAQTVSNVYKALDAGLAIIPVLNKIDLQSSEIEKVADDLVKTFGFEKRDIMKVSAKMGDGVEDLIRTVIKKIPPPQGSGLHSGQARCRARPDVTDVKSVPTRALTFDTHYDEYLGVIALVKIVDGSFEEGQKIKFLATGKTSTLEELGMMQLKRKKLDKLNTGEVGYFVTGVKDIHAIKVGDTVTLADNRDVKVLPGYKEIKPFVFVSIYPTDNGKFPELRKALERLSLTDAALVFEPENNSALGFGFRCGFLGILHADIIQERLEREYDLDLISTTPTVEYEVVQTDGTEVLVKTPSELPIPTKIREIKEPWILLNIVTPVKYIGSVINLCQNRRGVQKKVEYPSPERVILEYELPLSELIYNFFDDLKSVSSGFASLDYELLDYKAVNAVKMDILVHGEVVDPLSHIVLKVVAAEKGRALLKKLKEVIPRQQFKVALQAAIGGKIIAREDIPAMRKHVLGGIYGGHRERKDKLLERQKKGKARMKRFGKVDIPQEAFRQVLQS